MTDPAHPGTCSRSHPASRQPRSRSCAVRSGVSRSPGTPGGLAILDRAPFDPALGKLKEALYQAGASGFLAILEAARAHGQLTPGTETTTIIEQLAGPLFYRRLFAGRPIDTGYVDTIVDDVLHVHGVNP
jgi:Tetracyclin repressor-like, C-terminal domain